LKWNPLTNDSLLGQYSKVLVPSAAPKIAAVANALDFVGWAYFDYEIGDAIHECSELLH